MTVSFTFRSLLVFASTCAVAALVACSEDETTTTTTSGNDAGSSSTSSGGTSPDAGSGDAGTSGEAGGPTPGNTCVTLCSGGGFATGTQEIFGGNVVECTCSGAGTGIAKSACEAYCAPFGVSADKSLLSTENGPNDKCVCDGT